MEKEDLVPGYRVEKVLGEGGYASVSLATCTATGQKVAIKAFNKDGVDPDHLKRIRFEVKVMKALKHPNIVHLMNSHETDKQIFLVMQYCCGGELLQHLIKNGRMAEPDAKKIFKQICLAVNFAHHSGFIHRDLKLDNIFLDEDGRALIGDWGLSGKWRKGHYHTHIYGTCNFASPEMVREQDYVGPEVDAWSLGIILYALVTGTLPFNGKDDDDYAKLIARGTFKMPDYVSQECKSLLRCLLAINSKDRSSVADTVRHPFLQNVESEPVPIPAPKTRRHSHDSSSPTSCGLLTALFHHRHQSHDQKARSGDRMS